jgi:hypothetical protein
MKRAEPQASCHPCPSFLSFPRVIYPPLLLIISPSSRSFLLLCLLLLVLPLLLLVFPLLLLVLPLLLLLVLPPFFSCRGVSNPSVGRGRGQRSHPTASLGMSCHFPARHHRRLAPPPASPPLAPPLAPPRRLTPLPPCRFPPSLGHFLPPLRFLHSPPRFSCFSSFPLPLPPCVTFVLLVVTLLLRIVSPHLHLVSVVVLWPAKMNHDKCRGSCFVTYHLGLPLDGSPLSSSLPGSSVKRA